MYSGERGIIFLPLVDPLFSAICLVSGESLSKFDRQLLGFFSILSIVFFIVNLDPGRFISLFDVTKRGESLAKIKKFDNHVYLKANGFFTWSEVYSVADLYENDRLLTGENSKVVVAFNDGTVVDVLENSLILIEDPLKKQINLESGSFVIRSKPASKMKVKSSDKVYDITGDAVEQGVLVVKEDQGQLKISSDESLMITHNKQKIAKTKNEQLLIKQTGVVERQSFSNELIIDPTTSLADSANELKIAAKGILSDDDQLEAAQDLNFTNRYKAAYRKDRQAFWVKLTSKEQFLRIVNSQGIVSPVIRLPKKSVKPKQIIAPGLSAEQVESGLRKLASVEVSTPPLVDEPIEAALVGKGINELSVDSNISVPTLLSPRHQAAVLRGTQFSDQPFLFSWQSVATAGLYEFQVAKDSEFKQIFNSFVTKSSHVLINEIPIGIFHWRVRVKNGGTVSEWSDPKTFRTYR